MCTQALATTGHKIETLDHISTSYTVGSPETYLEKEEKHQGETEAGNAAMARGWKNVSYVRPAEPDHQLDQEKPGGRRRRNRRWPAQSAVAGSDEDDLLLALRRTCDVLTFDFNECLIGPGIWSLT